jgi:hypothetical protein
VWSSWPVRIAPASIWGPAAPARWAPAAAGDGAVEPAGKHRPSTTLRVAVEADTRARASYTGSLECGSEGSYGRSDGACAERWRGAWGHPRSRRDRRGGVLRRDGADDHVGVVAQHPVIFGVGAVLLVSCAIWLVWASASLAR